MKLNWRGILAAIDLRTICRRYTVDFGDYETGRVEYFWFRKSAEEFHESLVSKKKFLFVTLQDWWIEPEKPDTYTSMGNPATLRRYRALNASPPIRYTEKPKES